MHVRESTHGRLPLHHGVPGLLRRDAESLRFERRRAHFRSEVAVAAARLGLDFCSSLPCVSGGFPILSRRRRARRLRVAWLFPYLSSRRFGERRRARRRRIPPRDGADWPARGSNKPTCADRDSSRLLGDGYAVDPLNRAALIAASPKNLKTLELGQTAWSTARLTPATRRASARTGRFWRGSSRAKSADRALGSDAPQ